EFWERAPLDSVDVADLESERAHDYAVLPATQMEDVVITDGVVVDGARRNRQRDTFWVDVAPRARFVARLGTDEPVTVTLRIGGRLIDTWLVSKQTFEEHAASLPEDQANGPAQVEVRAETGAFTAAHYWVY
ncbi:MAG TPA: hypothetical protein VIK01_05535, partial [Polyangiaceae bacterium]